MPRDNNIIQGDCIEVMRGMDSESVDCVITSPPYWGLRDYGIEGQMGLEASLEEYHTRLLEVTAECKRVLKKAGTMFWVHGDSYASSGNIQPKSLFMQNYRLSMRMVDEQEWILRNILIWHKNNHMPSSVQDRFTNAYEPVFFYSKSAKYFFALDAIRIPSKSGGNHVETHKTKGGGGAAAFNSGRMVELKKNGQFTMSNNPAGKNPGDVFTLSMQPFPGAHFAVFPEKLIEPFIKAGCPPEVCKHCGFIRERIAERTPMKIKRSSWGEKAGSRTAPSGTMLSSPTSKMLGWTDCECKDKNKYKPGILLDPFMGAGTTAVVAKKLGRLYRGIEINPEYIEIARKRISKIPERLDRFV